MQSKLDRAFGRSITAKDLADYVTYNPTTGDLRYGVMGKKHSSGYLKGKIGEICGHISPEGYRKVTIEGVVLYAHRLAWFLHYGEWPSSMLDHVDRDRQNNRIANLRLANHHQNGYNAKIAVNNTSGVRGVSQHRGKYMVFINLDGKNVNLGSYADLNMAAAVRRAVEKVVMRDFRPK